MSINLFKLLDTFLKTIAETTIKNPLELDIIKLNNDTLKEISDRDWNIIVTKLLDDKMITSIIKEYNSVYQYNAYFITFDGLLLLEFENGYYGRYIKQQSETERIKSLENIQKKNSSWIVLLTALTFLAAAVSCWTNILTYQNQKYQNNQKSFYRDTFLIKQHPNETELNE